MHILESVEHRLRIKFMFHLVLLFNGTIIGEQQIVFPTLSLIFLIIHNP